MKRHQNVGIEQQRKSITIKRQSVANSPFISQGDFLKDVESNKYYDYSNMEYVIDEKTKQKKVLGIGAFGSVYLVRHKEDKALFAIKHIDKLKVQENGAKLDIIYREIQIQRRIVHENIVRLYSYVETKDAFFMVKVSY